MNDLQIEIKLLADCIEHIPSLAQLQFDAISQHWVPGATVEQVAERLTKHANHEKLPLSLVALQDNNPLGMVSLRENDGIRLDLAPWLGSLVVNPRYRGMGLGIKLIEACKTMALARGNKMLYLLAFDPTIPDWYARLGWKRIGTDMLFGHQVAVMELKLSVSI